MSWIFTHEWKPHHWNSQEPRTRCICLWHMWPQLHNRFFKHLEYTQYLVLVGGDCPLSNAKTQGRIQASSKPYVTNITCHIAVYFMLGSSKSKRQNITQWPFYQDSSIILGGNMHPFQSKMGNISIFERFKWPSATQATSHETWFRTNPLIFWSEHVG